MELVRLDNKEAKITLSNLRLASEEFVIGQPSCPVWSRRPVDSGQPVFLITVEQNCPNETVRER